MIPRPDYGPDWVQQTCRDCSASWVAHVDDGGWCSWCQQSLERLYADTRTDLLRPAWLDPTVHGPRYDQLTDDSKLVWDRTRGQVHGSGSAVTWAARLARGVESGLITESEARQALRRADDTVA